MMKQQLIALGSVPHEGLAFAGEKKQTKKPTSTSVWALGSLLLMTLTIAWIPPLICSGVCPWLFVPTHNTTTFKNQKKKKPYKIT